MGFRVSRFNIGTVGLFSLILFTGVLSIPGFSSQSNEVIDDSIEQLSFDLIQLSFATHSTEAYANVTASNVTPYISGDAMTNFEVTAQDTIPNTPDPYINSIEAFGYAWLDSASFPANAVVSTIHPLMNDSFAAPHAWHTHDVVLNADGCVSTLDSLESLITIENNVILTLAVEPSVVTSSNFQSASSFEFVTDTTTCPAPLNGLRMVK